ncbi:hypothetical protein PsYK624_115870 [Phanerochaete sordida]|uniref:Uncharacterized protein n=1 Tax=Phanerochaete sordida TaxID=48140 RepID=A0A9P3GG59_9APHY|nr:hypothetical protein PsYK624_115870 [Phanerochaete sordida]
MQTRKLCWFRGRIKMPLSVPQDIIDAIVGEVWDDDLPYRRSNLGSCSTVCSVMLHLSTKHLLKRVQVSSENVSTLTKPALRKSPKQRRAIGDPFIAGEEWPNLTQVPQEQFFALLSLLPALCFLRLGCVHDGLRRLAHTINCVFHAVNGVDTRSMYGGSTDGDVHTPKSHAQVRTIELHGDPETTEWVMSMFNPDSVRSIQFAFCETKWVRILASDPFGPFLESYGVHVEYMSFGIPAGGKLRARGVEKARSVRGTLLGRRDGKRDIGHRRAPLLRRFP